MIFRSLAIGLVVLGMGGAAAAQTPQAQEDKRENGWFGNFAFVSSGVDPGAAKREGIGARGFGFLFDGGAHLQEMIVVGGELGFQFVSDKASFGNSTTGGYKTSTTGIWDLAGYVGVRAPSAAVGSQGWRVTGGVNVGVGIAGGRRSIDNCIDCDEETLHLDGGVYFEPIVTFFKRGRTSCGVSYRVYREPSDVRNMFVVRIGRIIG